MHTVPRNELIEPIEFYHTNITRATLGLKLKHLKFIVLLLVYIQIGLKITTYFKTDLKSIFQITLPKLL